MARRPRILSLVSFTLAALLVSIPAVAGARPKPAARPISIAADPAAAARQKLRGFDAWMEKTRAEWNCPGLGVVLVVGDQVVLSKGYGYRDWGAKLPFTAQTVTPIGSDTKLFTAVVAGTLVEEGKLAWDEPIRKFVPSIKFYDNALDESVTLRDMLSHRTGTADHGRIAVLGFGREELFEKLRYLEPKAPIRTSFRYSNLMYAGVGRALELVSGKSWEELVQERILDPLGMKSTNFRVDALTAAPDHAVPWSERRDSAELHEVPYSPELVGAAPAGAINSNLEDLSQWLRLLLHEGKLGDRQVLPAEIFRQTLAPAMPVPVMTLDTFGWTEVLNSIYGMGRLANVYRGQRLVDHGGHIDGFFSEVAIAPEGGFGLAVLVIGDHAAQLQAAVTFDLVERMFDMEPRTPWSARLLDLTKTMKQSAAQARAKPEEGRIEGTHPAHPLADYAGEFEHPAYGLLTIAEKDGSLEFRFHQIGLPLSHFHYERFDTPDDELQGRWSVNFGTDSNGKVATATQSLDGAELTFTRRAASGDDKP